MNLKQNVNYIKEEMQNDEKMLEGLLRIESWLRRNKNLLITLTAILIVLVASYNANAWYEANTQKALADAYEQALKGNETAIKKLSDSKSALYDLYRFQKAVATEDKEVLKLLESSKDPMIARFAKMQNASLEQNLNVLNTQDSGDFGYLQAAFLEIQAGNLQNAKEILSKIQNDSPIRDIANTLQHLSIKGINDAQ